MKNLCWLTAIIIFLVCCKEPLKEKATYPSPITQYRSWEEVETAAAQYGLESVIQEKNNNGLMYLSDTELDAFLEKEKENRNVTKELDIYLDRTKDVHSFDDFLTLINTLPNAKWRFWVEPYGGEAGFQRWADEQRKIKWHIYRDDHGALTWVRPEDDHGTEQGTRMDREK